MGLIVSDLATIIHYHAPQLPEERRHAGAAVLVHIIKGMLGLLESADPKTHSTILAEVKQMSLLYFYDLVASGEK